MGTRADFYIGSGPSAQWLGSVAWDGYEWAETKGNAIADAKTEDAFRSAVTHELESRDDGTTPSEGWPWPWNDSATTDYTYYFQDGSVHWDDRNDWPDMSAIKKVRLGGPKSGLIVIST